MILKNTLNLHTIQKEHLMVRFLPTGDLYDMMYDNIQINLQKGNIIDGSLANIYIRLEDKRYFKLLSSYIEHISSFESGMIFKGRFESITYEVVMSIYPNGWTYSITLSSPQALKAQLFYGQDIGIQDINGILNNEAYIVQYIDYKAFKDDLGYTLCARQNQGQPAYFQMGMDINTIGYATDAMQFFKTEHKQDGHIYAMDDETLPNTIYQYEQSYLTLQSETFTIDQASLSITCYGYFEPNHEAIISSPKTVHFEPLAFQHLKDFNTTLSPHKDIALLHGTPITLQTIDTLYPNRTHEEYHYDDLYSFFLVDHSYITTSYKEKTLERATGHILMQGDVLHATENVLTTTSYMHGIFLSHVALGNTSFHKLLGDHRHALMLHKMAGFRLYIKLENTYKLLGMPSLYEIGLQHNIWTYILEDDILRVFVYGDIKSQEVQIKVTSQNEKTYQMFFTMQLLMGPVEWLYDLDLTYIKNGFEVITPKGSMAFEHYPNLTYHFHGLQEIAFTSLDYGLIKGDFKLDKESHFVLSAAFGKPNLDTQTLENVCSNTQIFYDNVLNHIQLEHDTYDTLADIHMLYWYTHNALIHYASPHGLEQYNGAAWGTRDVCQGPFELFSALQKDNILKHILKTVYGRQFLENGDFPQWFMYDKYKEIQAHESHGDVIFWPLKSLAYYLRQTGDLSILNEKVAYYSLHSHRFTEPSSIYEHVQLQIKHMLSHTIFNLPIYGGGDWDDTLQPANNTLKERMVSGWTAILMIQSLESFASEILTFDANYAHDILGEVKKIKQARKDYLLPDGIPAGFVVFESDIKYLLHPKDKETSLQYRLLPITRSMIAGLNTELENTRYLDLIDTYLKHPDGVRLMDHAVLYQGGKRTHFNRAETAANFGREIGLQYVHAHIRYIEAMYAINQMDRAHEGLMMIHPIHLHHHVKHAMPRQRNAYFSSSDGNFKDRYEAKKHFNLLRTGDINVKGGWRIYSSGPGILIHQMITNTFGIKRYHNEVSIEPKLPKHLNQLKVTMKKEHD